DEDSLHLLVTIGSPFNDCHVHLDCHAHLYHSTPGSAWAFSANARSPTYLSGVGRPSGKVNTDSLGFAHWPRSEAVNDMNGGAKNTNAQKIRRHKEEKPVLV